MAAHMTVQEFDSAARGLANAWCDRREFALLREMLRAYPRATGLGDEWGELANALKTIRSRHRSLLPPHELERVIELQQFAEAALNGRV
jgi:hypothetical protein